LRKCLCCSNKSSNFVLVCRRGKRMGSCAGAADRLVERLEHHAMLRADRHAPRSEGQPREGGPGGKTGRTPSGEAGQFSIRKPYEPASSTIGDGSRRYRTRSK
jgi:hypothetical protein